MNNGSKSPFQCERNVFITWESMSPLSVLPGDIIVTTPILKYSVAILLKTNFRISSLYLVQIHINYFL